MAPATPSISSRPPSRATAPQNRVTRLRAKEPSSLTAASPAQPSRTGLLARSKEGLRLVGEKMKEKEKERGAGMRPKAVVSAPTTYGESLQAFLRIRPTPSDSDASQARPYLEMQGDKDVLMRAPADTHRPNMPKPPHIYSFDRVFGPTSSQSDFFANTTLPLVDQLLKGENGLLFAYGVSNSGKTYSVTGGNTINSADRGVLPRAIDVVFNSISGLESTASLRCQGLADVVLTDEEDPAVLDGFSPDYEGISDESIKVDRNHSYAVFVSYAEVYNEKIFDLLENVLPIMPSGKMGSGSGPGTGSKRPSSHMAFPGAFASSMNLAAMANGGGGILKRKALVLKNDPEGNGKYVAGLSDVRVKTRQEALAVFRTGQRARQVFGTLANRESSRSHGIFTLKVVRIHNGAPNDPESAQVSRLAIVDLAGSERTRNTQTTGDRLKEAGNINKSLMVLGQCLEVLRSNQEKMAAPTPAGSKKRLAMVPFRHSKLTEIFQNFFVGDGRAVMIVHVNPYDTGFDENSHVMRFSAIAREIQTTAQNKVGFPLLKRQISTQFSALRQAVSGPMKVKVVVPVLPRQGIEAPPSVRPGPFQSKAGMRERESDGYIMVEEEIEVVEEDGSEDEEEDDETDWMVEHLFEQLKEVKQRLYESEMRNATIESEVREEAAQEMQEALQRMHDDFAKMFQHQLEAAENKTDRKLDILSRTIPTPGPSHSRQAGSNNAARRSSGDTSRDLDSEADISMEEQSFESAEQSLLDSEQDASMEETASASDPFLMPSTSTRASVATITQRLINVNESDETDEAGSSAASETDSGTDEEDDEEAVIATLTPDVRYQSQPRARLERESRHVQPIEVAVADISIESEDPLAAMDNLGVSRPSEADEDDDEEEDDEEEEEELEDSEEDVTDSEEEEEDISLGEADEEDAAEAESSFAASASTDRSDGSASDFGSDKLDSGSGSDSDDSIIGRSAARRRKTGSPIKKSRASALIPKPKPAPKRASTVKAQPNPRSTPAKVKSPLQERSNQETVQSDEDEIVAVKTPLKKKRLLGKKVMTEDEMIAVDSQVGNGVAEVRRMMRDSGQFTPIRSSR